MKTPSKGCLVTQSELICPLYYEMGHSPRVPWSLLGLLVLLTRVSSVPGSLLWLMFHSVTHMGGPWASQHPGSCPPCSLPSWLLLTPLSVPAPGSTAFVVAWLGCSFLRVTGKKSTHCPLSRRANVSVCHSSWRSWPGAQPTWHEIRLGWTWPPWVRNMGEAWGDGL